MNLNLVILIGRITRDAESKVVPSGQTVVNFSLATNSVWFDKDQQKQESTQFHNIVFWGKKAEAVAPYLKKGTLVMIEGKLRNSSWVGQDNQKKYRTEVFVKNLQLAPRALNVDSFETNKSNEDTKKEEIEEDLPVIQDGDDVNPFEEDLEGDEIPF